VTKVKFPYGWVLGGLLNGKSVNENEELVDVAVMLPTVTIMFVVLGS
jgi:hypothetical protein